ncbi:hypothetical protein GUITHDRAFT_101645 [Guillardia theta CCMP2712]|uniref:TRP C-terminal domain-containing protein n=1 Tax=Guillardia theta (strain CCMP2712) TaxID=905079 RepID=L1JWK1_GUITC|nr:hypothetical protein GUITHDRAFT_101645 [Guillardia theta CCMP2712]EKX52473.1 hypothetical protein GUITHDRAFT_101645 [Guillardia theta CCMP2712]|eukprot:XP_005839453.1 hypothetical protein GUITHDRAFT_101645 [Guillardia theta CCMP2712]
MKLRQVLNKLKKGEDHDSLNSVPGAMFTAVREFSNESQADEVINNAFEPLQAWIDKADEEEKREHPGENANEEQRKEKRKFTTKKDKAEKDKAEEENAAAAAEEEQDVEAQEEKEAEAMARKQLRSLCDNLVKRGIVQLPVLSWKQAEGAVKEGSVFAQSERHAMQIAGFLFSMYEVKYWWFEVLELMRRLLTCIIISFFFTGTIFQVVVGLMLLFLSLAAHSSLKPFQDISQDNMMFYGLIANFATLLYGISLRLMEVSELRIDSTTYELDLVQILLVAANIFVLVFPITQTLLDLVNELDSKWLDRMEQQVDKALSRIAHNCPHPGHRRRTK